MILNKFNFKKFTRRNLLPSTDGSQPSSKGSRELLEQNMELLEQFHNDFNSLQNIREKIDRCWRYYFGNQLSDIVYDPDSCGMITEEEYMRKQGIVPMAMNIMQEPIINILGVYRKNRLMPYAVSRDRDEQKLGEMMTVALEYAYDNLNLEELNGQGFLRSLVAALVCFRIGFGRDDEKHRSDAIVELCDINRMAWDDNTSGLYFKHINRIGYLHDMPMNEVLKFAHNNNEVERIKKIYQDCWNAYSSYQKHERDIRHKNISFYTPLNPQHCRVIEIWTKETQRLNLFHDTAKGEEIETDNRYDSDIITENQRRQLEMIELGGSVEDAALIEYNGFKPVDKWVVRYLTPNGYILKQEETPYWHGSHPFVIGGYPMVNGEVHSLAERLINIQRVYNSTFMSNRYIRMNQAKGSKAVNRKVLQRSKVSAKQLAAIYTDPSAIIELDWEPGEEVFKSFSDNTQNYVDEITPQKCLELMDKISGNTGAIRGEAPKANTPSSLYAQQTENSTNNIADITQWYNGLIKERDYKLMMIIQQYYDERRFLNIVGKHYSKESRWYDPEKVRNTKFDIALVESTSNGIARAQSEEFLQNLFSSGQIDIVTYLENSSMPFADKVLESIKSRQEEQQEQEEQQDKLQQTSQNIPVQPQQITE